MLELQANPRSWVDEFVRAADLRELGLRSDLQRDVRTGALVPVCRGVYRRAASVVANDDDDRYLALLRATHLAWKTPLVFAYLSAARMWQLPMLGRWPDAVHVTGAREDGGRSTAHLVRHSWGIPGVVVELDGLRVTSLVQSVLDVARGASFEVGVAMADSALRGLPSPRGGWLRAPLPRSALEEAVASSAGARGSARAREVIAFADPLAESAGESLSRVGIRRLHLPAPVLQHEFSDRHGRMVVDFWWPEANLVGEFDGQGKYLREQYTRGRSTAEIVLAEKRREDRIRALGPSVTRWGWETARSLPLLRAQLSAAGLRAVTHHR